MALNETFYISIENNPLERLKRSPEEFKSHYESIKTILQITEIIKLIFCVFVIIVDIYLIIAITRNKRLRAYKTNKYVLNYAIYNLLSTIFPGSLTFLVAALSLINDFGWFLVCFAIQLNNCSLIGLFLSSFALSSDWLITVYYNSNVNQSILQSNAISLTLINVLVFALIILCTLLSFNDILFTNTIFCIIFVILVVLLIFMLYCNYIKRKIPNPTSEKLFPLRIATIMILCWLPVFIYDLILKLFHVPYNFLFLLLVTYMIPFMLAYGSPIIVIFFLGKLNKHYKDAFIQCWFSSFCYCRKSKRNYTENEESIKKDENEENVNTSMI